MDRLSSDDSDSSDYFGKKKPSADEAPSRQRKKPGNAAAFKKNADPRKQKGRAAPKSDMEYRESDEDYSSSDSDDNNIMMHRSRKKSGKAATKPSRKSSNNSKGSIGSNTNPTNDAASSPAKKKPRDEEGVKKKPRDEDEEEDEEEACIDAIPTTCNKVVRGYRVCGRPVAKERPPQALKAGATLIPNYCDDHQRCAKCNCQVGPSKRHKEEGLCIDHLAAKKDEETKAKNQQWVGLQIAKLDNRSRKVYSDMASGMNKGAISPPTVLKGLPSIDTENVAEWQIGKIPGMDGVTIKSSDESAGRAGPSLEGVNVIVYDGNVEPNSEPTLRTVIKDMGPCPLGGKKRGIAKVDGIDTPLHVNQFAILRDEKGSAFEKEFLNSNSTRKLLFVHSKFEVDFEEKRENTYLGVETYLKHLKPKGRSSHFQLCLGVIPVSEKDARRQQVREWLETKYPVWEQMRRRKNEPVEMMDIIQELTRINVSCVIYIFTSFIQYYICLIITFVSVQLVKRERQVLVADEKRDDELLQKRFSRASSVSNICELAHFFEESIAIQSTNIDALVNLPATQRPNMFHTTYHAPRGGQNNQVPSVGNQVRRNENYRFSKTEYVATLSQLGNFNPSGCPNWIHLVTFYGPMLRDMDYGDGTSFQSAVHDYLDQCDDKLCLIGSAHLRNRQLDQTNADNAPGAPLSYSPHVTPNKANNPRVYVSGSLPACLRRFRAKNGWEQYYGWLRQNGDRATVCIIDKKFWPLIQRVGLTGLAMNDLGSTLLPLQICMIYEVTWKSENLYDSTWRKIYENGNWIPIGNQVEISYNQVSH